MYSQNKEEQFIIEYFTGYDIGSLTIADIGANNGITFSNSLRLIELGSKALLVEPSETAYKKLIKLHEGNKNVSCVNVAISDQDGEMDFFESGTHLKNGDTALLSTLKESELKRWEGSDNEFTLTKTHCITIESLLKIYDEFPYFDFISIDAEGVDLMILKQLELSKTKLICIEHNGNKEDLLQIKEYCAKFGIMRVIYTNAENVIIGR